MPTSFNLELLWKSYIDFEILLEEFDRARDLYESLIVRTNHIKVWISYAEFEKKAENIVGARTIYERANKALESSDKEERLMLLETWLDAERMHGKERDIKRFVPFQDFVIPKI